NPGRFNTLGLEASYLAAGQARRVEEIRQSLAAYRKWSLKPFDESRGIQTGDLVAVEALSGQTQYLFLGPDAAGLKVSAGEQLVTVITAKAPLGQSLLGKFEDDAVQIVINGSGQSYEITQTM
ncbi:transcription elongation factor GreAB, partial [Pseudomonas savastanoi]